jgi:glycine/D-amino acid oxidase-like deaminating enzyme
VSASVTIAGGGLAGLTAALRLAERGHRVKLYERSGVLGGDLGSRPAGAGLQLDVYPHMYLNWYRNFWALVGAADRGARFRPLDGVKQLAAGDYPRFTGLIDPYKPWMVPRNMFDGPEPPPDLYLFFYASIDLLAERLNPTLLLDDVSVNGFLHSRPYMTERAAELFDNFIINVWGVPSYLVAAGDYQDFLAYSAADPTPPFWLARGSAFRQVIEPLERMLAEAGVEVVRHSEVVGASCAQGRVEEIELRDGRVEAVDELVLAVPPTALTRIVRSGARGARIVEAAPELAQVSRLRAQPVPILYLFLRRRLHVPPEPVGLAGSRYGLAFTDISQTWQGVPEFAGRTVLALSASDPFGLPGTGDSDDAMAMLRELARFLRVDAGGGWGDSPDVDWELTHYASNADAQLFLNETGSDVYRPPTDCPQLPNLALAGDFTDNRIGMTTIESAVTSGLEAAQSIVLRRGGAAVEIVEPRALPSALWLWLRYACMPYAASASVWSRVVTALRRQR